MFSKSLVISLGSLLALSLALSPKPVAAQPPVAPADTTLGWSRQVNGLLNLSQSYYDNWVKGGTDALSWEVNLGGRAALNEKDFLWENSLKAVYGQTKIQGFSSRKSSDEWNLETIYTRKLGTWVNPFASARGQSQFTAGYSYDSVGVRTQISDFFDPAYFLETVGIGITPVKDLTERLGVTMKQTISDTYSYADDKETLGDVETFKQEYGLSSVTDYSFALMENILAKTRLDVFANFQGFDEVDMRWANQVTAKVNKLISMNLELEILYDKDLSEESQTRQSLSVGIALLSL